MIRWNYSLGLLPEQLHSVRLLDNRIDNLLPGEEVPHAAPVELVSKRVEEGVEDGVRLCQNWKHLRTETKSYIMFKEVDFKRKFGKTYKSKIQVLLNWNHPLYWVTSYMINFRPFFTIMTMFSNNMLDSFKWSKRSPFLVSETQPWRSRSRRRCTWGRRGPSTSAWPSRAYWC